MFKSPVKLSDIISVSEDSVSVASLDNSSVCIGVANQSDRLTCHQFPSLSDQVFSSGVGLTQIGQGLSGEISMPYECQIGDNRI